MLKKIIHVTRRFVESEWGGTETVVYNLAKELNRQGIQSPVFTTDFLSQAGDEDLQGVGVRRFRSVLPWLGLSPAAKQQLELKGGSPLSFALFQALLREPDLSVVHSHVMNRLGGIARTVARLRGIPYIVTVHGGCMTLSDEQAQQMSDPTKGSLEWGKAFGFLLGSRRTLDDADAIIAVGKDEQEALQRRFPEKKVVYLPNGVNTKQFSNADPSLFREYCELKTDQPFILCVSRIDPQKNQRLLLRAFARFAKESPEHHLVLIGPITVPSYHATLLADAQELNIADRLQIVPGLCPTDPLLASAYAAADLFVLPSRMEPFGIVILEAWAAGTPVIASKVGGIPGFTSHQKDILHFDSDDEQDLVHQMLRSAHARETLIHGGLETVKAYDWSSITSDLLDLYHDVCDRKRAESAK